VAGMRNYPLLIGAGVALLISGLVGAAAITGALPMQKSAVEMAIAGPALENTATAAAAKKANCRTCGVVAAVRKVEVNGNDIDQAAKKQSVYRLTVRMDDGSERTVTQPSAPSHGVGARVRVNGNVLERG
jgi:outer membrane lipoprotein SlyB